MYLMMVVMVVEMVITKGSKVTVTETLRSVIKIHEYNKPSALLPHPHESAEGLTGRNV